MVDHFGIIKEKAQCGRKALFRGTYAYGSGAPFFFTSPLAFLERYSEPYALEAEDLAVIAVFPLAPLFTLIALLITNTLQHDFIF
ncbi:hypothetical protein KUF71_007964 [Frankliniella fusca]|uniref:Uncharacterized protein n=1 Tax=Frankliniella fusca TaxID=407009 RepID=A0AAE1HC83_9NEOP|nr:hypothetical protein KUF71_007964 [Frankliniella fusca]